MSEIPDEAVGVAAETMAEMWNQRLSEEDAPYVPSDFTSDARDVLAAAAPIIRADERQRTAEQIRAERDRCLKTLDLMQPQHNGRIRGLAIAAQIAERGGK